MIKRYSSVTYNTLEILIDHLDFFKNAKLQFEILSLTHMIKTKMLVHTNYCCAL